MAGYPILDYIISNLDNPRITDIFLFTSKHQEKLEKHIEGIKIKAKIEVYSAEVRPGFDHSALRSETECGRFRA